MVNKSACCGAVIPDGKRENKKRVVYAEDVLNAMREDPTINGANVARVRRHLAAVTTVDAVEVVRCKDCKHYGDYGRVRDCNKYGAMSLPDDDDFCSYGERREGE